MLIKKRVSIGIMFVIKASNFLLMIHILLCVNGFSLNWIQTFMKRKYSKSKHELKLNLSKNFAVQNFFFVWANCIIRCRVLLFEASPQCHHREPPNQVSHLEGGTSTPGNWVANSSKCRHHGNASGVVKG